MCADSLFFILLFFENEHITPNWVLQWAEAIGLCKIKENKKESVVPLEGLAQNEISELSSLVWMTLFGRCLPWRRQHVEGDTHPVFLAFVDFNPMFQPAREYVHSASFWPHTHFIGSEICLLADGIG